MLRFVFIFCGAKLLFFFDIRKYFIRKSETLAKNRFKILRM